MADNIDNSDESTIVVKETINSVQDEDGDQTDVTKSMLWEEKTIDSDELNVRRVRRNSGSLSVGPSNKACVPSRYISVSVGSCHDKCKFGHGHSEMKAPLLRTLSEGKGLLKKSADEESEMHARKVKHGGAPTVERNKPPLKVGTGSAKKPLETASDKVREIQVTTSEEKPIRCGGAGLPSEPPMKNVVNTNGGVCRDLSGSSHHRKQEAQAKQPEDVSVKTLYMIEPNSLSKPEGTSQNSGLQRKRSEKAEVTARVGTKAASKARQNTSLNSHMSKSLLGSSEKSFKSDKGESGKAELVHIKHIDCKPGTPRGKESKLKKLNPCKSKEEELGKTESVNSEHSDSRDSKPGTSKAKQNAEPKAMAKRAGKSQVLEEEEDSDSAWRMKFKRGKSIDISSSNNRPMKLKFGRTVSLNDNEHIENNTAKVSYRRKEAGGGEEAQAGSAESEKVVLRHQEAAVKKNGDVNLNNVIKETASKLVKTRKSKVKALVGAFETAMSLYDEASKATSSGTT